MRAWHQNSGSDGALGYLLFLISTLKADQDVADQADELVDVHGRLKQAKRDREDAWEPVVMGRGRVQFSDLLLNRVVAKFWNMLSGSLEWLRGKIFKQPPSVTTRGQGDTQRRRVEDLLGEAKVRTGEAEEVADYTPRVQTKLDAVETARQERTAAHAAWRDAYRAERAIRDEARVLVRKTYGALIQRFPNDMERVEAYFPDLRDIRPTQEDDADDEPIPQAEALEAAEEGAE